jgi:hypothetical protein
MNTEPSTSKTKAIKPTSLAKLVEKFQCPGCTNGSNTRCGSYKSEGFDNGGRCASHVPGTAILGVGTFSLGLPKGFNRLSPPPVMQERHHYAPLVLWPAGTHGGFNRLNMAVWAMEGTKGDKGFLFVRVVEPRVGRVRVDVIEGGKLDDAAGALNVAEFIDEID